MSARPRWASPTSAASSRSAAATGSSPRSPPGTSSPRRRAAILRSLQASPSGSSAAAESADTPRRSKCVYHRLGGCTVPPSRRSATCNYFLCADAFAEGGEPKGDPVALKARAIVDDLRPRYTRYDEEIAARFALAWPEWMWDAPLLDWLGQAFEALDREHAVDTRA